MLLLAMIVSATQAHAQGIGSSFPVNDIQYKITKNDLNHHTDNRVVVIYIGGSGDVVVPSTVKHPESHEIYKVVGSEAWTTCSNSITSLTFSEGYLEMGNGCYTKKHSLTKITFPASFNKLGHSCFEGSKNLTRYEVSDANSTYKNNSDGWLLTKDDKTLVSFPPGIAGDITIPNTITTLAQTAFKTCQNLRKVTIPASVISIDASENASFYATTSHITVDAANLRYKDINGVLFTKDGSQLITFPKFYDGTLTNKKYTVPNSTKIICSVAFAQIEKELLKSIDLNEVETLQPKAFYWANGLEEVTFGKSVNNIKDGAFIECPNLKKFIVDTNNNTYMGKDNAVFTKDEKTLVLYPTGIGGSYSIPAGTESIQKCALYGSQLSGIAFPSTLTKIGNEALRFSQIRTIDFGNDSHLKEIGNEAFAESKIDGTIILPASLETISYHVFYKTNVQSMHVADGSKLTSIPDKGFDNMPKLESFVFDGSVNALTSIASEAFADDPKLKNFEVPTTVTYIGTSAFLNTPALETVTFKEAATIKTIGNSAFSYSGIKTISLPESVTKIEKQAFDNCTNLKTIDIPKNVTTIETGAFNFCDNLTAINVDAANNYYASLDGMLTDKNKTTLVTFPAGKADSRYTLIPNFTTVGQYAFYSSNKVTNVTFPKTVTEIKTRALALCKNLKSLSFMGEDNVPTLTNDITYQSSSNKDITIFVRKKWYEKSANDVAVANYNATFKEVHPSFVTAEGYDRGTEFFPTSVDNVGVISFYKPRNSVIIDKTAKESNYTDSRGKTWPAKSYGVSTILDYAYQNETTVQDIVILADIGVIGLDAFKAGNQLKGIYFVDNTPAELNSVDYGMDADYPFNDGQAIYVRPSVVNDYKTAWEQSHTLGITHEIPQKTNAYGATRCYPFDVLFDNSGDVRPYLPVDFSHMTEATPYAKARRIDDGYVPAFLGVLLHSVNSASATSYCEMTEEQDHHAVTDPSGMYNASTYKMVGVVEDTQVSSTATNNCYAFSKSQGKFLKIKTEPQYNTMPYFSAYLKLNSNNQAKAFSFRFDDEGSSTTGIENTETAEQDNGNEPYYNLNGMRVSKPSKGVYIRNGKKVIIK